MALEAEEQGKAPLGGSSSLLLGETLDGELQNLKLDENEEAEAEEWRRDGDQYPLRPGEPDCAYYLKTGHCGYGARCKFNHPTISEWWSQTSWWIPPKSIQAFQGNGIKENLERAGQIECKFYLMPGGCKYGNSCKYGHFREKTNDEQVELNFLGLPLRPGQKECPYYLRTGCCKFSANCWFHHPEPTAVIEQDCYLGYQNGGVPQLDSGESSPLMAPASPSYQSQLNVQQHSSLSTLCAGPRTDRDDAAHQQANTEEYAKRHGQPECQYFMKYGLCRFKSSCIFHHPESHESKASVCILSPLGLPIRPDQPICTYYNRYGICKYGPSCKFDHSTNISNSHSLATTPIRL